MVFIYLIIRFWSNGPVSNTSVLLFSNMGELVHNFSQQDAVQNAKAYKFYHYFHQLFCVKFLLA